MEGENFSVEDFLTTTQFTIPVIIEDRTVTVTKGQKPPKRTILVTYEFDDELSKKFLPQDTPSTNGDGAGEDVETEKALSLNLNQQLALVIKKIDGVVTPPDEVFWSRVVLRYRTAILKAVLDDIYPNAMTSTGK
jgi:hypothetical protein